MGRVVCARERVSEFIEIQEGSFNTQFQQRSTLPWLPSTVPRGCACEKHNGIAEAMISVEGDSQGRRQRAKRKIIIVQTFPSARNIFMMGDKYWSGLWSQLAPFVTSFTSLVAPSANLEVNP